jgi:hypothetical protein
MINYSAIYTAGNRPYLAKVLVVSGESYETKLSPSMPRDEVDAIPLEVIYSHMDNIVLEIQNSSTTLQAVRLDEESIDLKYAISGYGELEALYDDAYHWFEYIYKNREPEELEEGTSA